MADDDAPRALSKLAGVATAVRDHTHVEAPTDEFRDRLRAELLEVAAAGRPTVWERTADRVEAATAGFRHSVRTAGAAALASALIGTTGVAAAAQSALPGQLLYPVKDLTEDARLAFASGDVERGRLHLAFARERLEEIETGRARLAPDQLATTFEHLDTDAATGADELLEASVVERTPELLDELDDFTAELRVRLLDVAPDLPLSVRASSERTLEVLRRIDVQVAGLLGPGVCEVCDDGAPAARARVVLPGDGPAVPACDCVRPAPSADAGDDPVGGPDPDEQPRDVPTEPDVVPDTFPDTPPPERHPTRDDLVGDVGNLLDDGADDLGTIVDDLLDPADVDDDTLDDLGDTVDEPVDDVASELGSATDDLGDGLLD